GGLRGTLRCLRAVRRNQDVLVQWTLLSLLPERSSGASAIIRCIAFACAAAARPRCAPCVRMGTGCLRSSERHPPTLRTPPSHRPNATLLGASATEGGAPLFQCDPAVARFRGRHHSKWPPRAPLVQCDAIVRGPLRSFLTCVKPGADATAS